MKTAKKPAAKKKTGYEYRPGSKEKEHALSKRHAAAAAAIIILVIAAYAALYPERNVTYNQLVGRLNMQGYEITEAGKIQQPFIPVEGQVINVGNEAVQVYTFEKKEDADRFVAAVSNDASMVEAINVTWSGEPHFYKAGKTVAIYIGENFWIQDAITFVLGRQFAGASDYKFCPSEERKGEFCFAIEDPVCGFFDPVKVQCEKYPCGQTYANSCFACKDNSTLYYTKGKCPEV
jgi:hypothetical protein